MTSNIKTQKGYIIKAFQQLNLHPLILTAIEDQGYPNPTKIQKKVIPLILKNTDVIAASKSGTGKTAAFVLPMLDKMHKIVKPDNHVLRGLIVVPTRELVDQISRNLSAYGKHLKIRHTKIQGGISKAVQLEKLATGIDIIVATPGRLKDFIEEGVVDISSVNMIVLDEADTMLELGFLEEIEYLISECSVNRQIMMFSATISQNIKKLAKEFLNNPVSIEVSNRRDVVALIKHKAYKIDAKKKSDLLSYVIKTSPYAQILVFVNTKEMADELNATLLSNKIKVATVHGDIVYQDRVKGIKDFRSKKIKVMIATDVAARGIDIKELPLVINYELPETTDDFTHRVGRTGRANNHGEVITFLTTADYNRFTKIERHLRLSIKREVIEGFELKDRQPRQRQQVKKSLSEKKGLKKPRNNSQKVGAKSKKTTKRDVNRTFRK
ncbi:MAG: DEAD/DEAH box helicase [Campylobacterota bacterium]|nr:DEAD/DEAH box helicase [Campylobacterota bacterium]